LRVILSECLEKYGWAFVLDVSSTGKTTLALRAASTPGQQEHPAFYLDLAKEIRADAELITALRKLSGC
jgi:hypothetical protein